MLKLAQKRGREWSESELYPCSPHKLPVENFSQFSPAKRFRNVEEGSPVNNNGFGFADTNMGNMNSSPMQIPRIRADSPFSQINSNPQQDAEMQDAVMKQVFAKKKKDDSAERLFTYAEVKEIIGRVVSEKEAAIKAEYDRVLHDCLQEQFRNFAKFNEDYVSRQFKQSDFSYLS